MPQIPGLPIDEPVAKPQAKPREFGIGGEVVSELGFDTEQMAQAAQQFAGHLIYAQRQLKAKQAEIQVGQLETQVHADLSKTTTPEGAQEVYDHFQKQLNDTLSPYQSDRELAKELGIYRQQVDVTMQGTVNSRKAKIITESTDAADRIQMETSSTEAINTRMAGGDISGIEARTKAKLQSSVYTGVKVQAQVDAEFLEWQKKVQEGEIKARIDSPDKAMRKEIIGQLKSGGRAFDRLDAATKNALYDEALERDKRLSAIAESNDLNAGLTRFDDLTKGWSYENKVKAASDNDWLRSHGYVDENGNPDKTMANHLLEEADRQESRANKVQADKDKEVVSKHFDAVDAGKLTIPQIDKIVTNEGGSPHAAATLKIAARAYINDKHRREAEDRSLSIQERQLRDQQEKEDSFATLGQIQLDIEQGKRYSDLELRGMIGRGKGKMSSAQVNDALRLSHSYETDPANKPYYQSIKSQDFGVAVNGRIISEFNSWIHDNPKATDDQKAAEVARVTDPVNRERISKAIEDINNPKSGSPTGLDWWRGIFGISSKPTGNTTFVDGDKTYSIPPDKIDSFKSQHPNATEPTTD